MNFEPGKVYRATVQGHDVIALGISDKAAYVNPPIDSLHYFEARDIDNARPLIVLDLASPAGFVTDLRWAANVADGVGSGLALRTIADQIEAQTKPPRIPEPEDIGGSVRASYSADNPRMVRRWTRFSQILVCNWIDTDGRARRWDDLIDPTLIRDGVS